MRSLRSHARGLVALLAGFGVAAALAGPSLAGAPKTLKLGTAPIATLDKVVLVNGKGRTLYTLSSESRRKIDCKSACLSLWPPLKIRKGVKPVGAAHLGVIKRREGFRQVTYKGRPLYRFSGDAKKGQANGEGQRFVGVWHAAAVGKTSTSGSGSSPTHTTAPEPTVPINTTTTPTTTTPPTTTTYTYPAY
jgi:predicted lipoprotein with Yx(FWY)xxD motif